MFVVYKLSLLNSWVTTQADALYLGVYPAMPIGQPSRNSRLPTIVLFHIAPRPCGVRHSGSDRADRRHDQRHALVVQDTAVFRLTDPLGFER